MSYEEFVAGKLRLHEPTGIEVPRASLHSSLFDFQKDVVTWALRRGRAAIFADTGLGKTRQQLEWARHVHRHTGRSVLILAPLAVAQQTAREGSAIGIDVTVCREDSDVATGVNVTNYDRLHKFDASRFGGVVLDESSIIKHQNSKTLAALLAAFRDTPFKLACTATPSPNDYTELGTHAEFLGVCSRAEMLAEYFCHDGGSTQDWRLKGHGRTLFWKWVSAWGVMLRKPSDLAYPDDAYNLPPLNVTQHIIEADHSQAQAAGLLFAEEAKGLIELKRGTRFHVHHIESFSTAPELRAEPDNLALLCECCHRFVHSKANAQKEFLA